MGNNKILPFAENAVIGQSGGVLAQTDYESDSQRTNGQSGMGRSQLNNKALKNLSHVAAGVGQFVANRVSNDVQDTNSLNIFESDLAESVQIEARSISNIWKANHQYNVGDLCVSSAQENSYKIMECITAGTSGSAEPTWGSIGDTTADNTIAWVVCDNRDTTVTILPGRKVVVDDDGKIPAALLPSLKGGYIGKPSFSFAVEENEIKLNGSLLNRSAYSELWEWASTKGLIVTEAIWNTTNASGVKDKSTLFSSGDSSTTFRIPDFRGKFLRFLDESSGIDPDGSSRTVGTTQQFATEDHTHYVNARNVAGAVAFGGVGGNMGNGTYSEGMYTGRKSTETRPINVVMIPVIQYK